MSNQTASSVSTFLHYNFSQISYRLVLSIHLVMHKTTIDPNKAGIAANSNQNKLSPTYYVYIFTTQPTSIKESLLGPQPNGLQFLIVNNLNN